MEFCVGIVERTRRGQADAMRNTPGRIRFLHDVQNALQLPNVQLNAVEAGLLPYRIIPLLRRGDAVTREQCREAMIAQGASVLMDPENPPLRFTSEEEAEACRQRLVRQLPRSEQVWSLVDNNARSS